MNVLFKTLISHVEVTFQRSQLKNKYIDRADFSSCRSSCCVSHFVHYVYVLNPMGIVKLFRYQSVLLDRMSY